ncbi:MAG: T9SS type A sorting domain-containing protein [Cytophagaceae bacterium]|nr:T9SS type A sorting domain-containing protein [Cytophagaceae bacterium]
MLKFLLSICLLFWFSPTFSQVTVRFDRLPATRQLVPRSEQNQADVNIEGAISTTGYERMAVSVFRNNQLWTYQSQALSYSNDTAHFSFKPSIRAELAEYRFEVFACRTSDSVRVALRDSVVCGDVFLIYGQSNAFNYFNYPDYRFQNEFCRTFGNGILPEDTTWQLANHLPSLTSTWGVELQRLIQENQRIPICLINGAYGGASIDFLSNRNDQNPADPSTHYGFLLRRVRKAGVGHAVKALWWWQGEYEAYGNLSGYEQKFPILYNNWLQDYPTVQKIYVVQVAIPNAPSAVAGTIRDFQRKTARLYPKIATWTSLGTSGFDGLHYSIDGYLRHAQQMYRLMARDFYGAKDQQNVDSPEPRKVFYASPENREITLIFDPTQQLFWQRDTTVTRDGRTATRKMVDYLYFDGQAGQIETLSARGNVVTITLKQPSTATKFTYLPGYFKDDVSNTYDGPHLRNARGMAAFSFENIPIAAALAAPKMTAEALNINQVVLSWEAVNLPGVEYVVERAPQPTGPFGLLLRTNKVASIDDRLPGGQTYYYRLKISSTEAESAYSAVVSATTLIPLEAPRLRATPISHRQIRLDWEMPVGTSGVYFRVERSLRAEADFAVVASPAGPTQFTDSLLTPATTYFYRVKAVAAKIESPYSTAVEATTLVLTALQPIFSDDVQVFPNPAERELRVSFGENAFGTYRLMDGSGKTLREEEFSQQKSLNLSLDALPAGIYTLQLDTGHQIISKKIVITR